MSKENLNHQESVVKSFEQKARKYLGEEGALELFKTLSEEGLDLRIIGKIAQEKTRELNDCKPIGPAIPGFTERDIINSWFNNSEGEKPEVNIVAKRIVTEIGQGAEGGS